METIESIQRIQPYNGYTSEPFFEGYESKKHPETCGYFDLDIDTQVRIPLKPIEEVKK